MAEDGRETALARLDAFVGEWRSEARFPDAGEQYVRHYFASRGVVRVHRMTFHDGLWTLARETPDLTPHDLAQRYTGTFSQEGRSIAGRWEISTDGSTWELDFALDYIKLS
jgi:hypothetical protein